MSETSEEKIAAGCPGDCPCHCHGDEEDIPAGHHPRCAFADPAHVPPGFHETASSVMHDLFAGAVMTAGAEAFKEAGEEVPSHLLAAIGETHKSIANQAHVLHNPLRQLLGPSTLEEAEEIALAERGRCPQTKIVAHDREVRCLRAKHEDDAHDFRPEGMQPRPKRQCVVCGNEIDLLNTRPLCRDAAMCQARDARRWGEGAWRKEL